MSAKLTPQQIVDELLAYIRQWSAREKENQIVAAYDGGMIAGMHKAITLIQRNLIDDVKSNNSEIPNSSSGGSR